MIKNFSAYLNTLEVLLDLSLSRTVFTSEQFIRCLLVSKSWYSRIPAVLTLINGSSSSSDPAEVPVSPGGMIVYVVGGMYLSTEDLIDRG